MIRIPSSLFTVFILFTFGNAMDLWTLRGRLSQVPRSLVAMTQLSRNLQQSTTWWQLTNAQWHPEALWRFMVLGAPPEYVFPNVSWTHKEELEILRRGGLSATKDAAVAKYETTIGRVGTGKIKLCAWVLMYYCLNSECAIVAPVILTQEQNKVNYATLWQNLFSASPRIPLLLPATTADIYERTRLLPRTSTSLQLRVAHNVELCNESIVMGRSPLDAAYKVPPGICYELAPRIRSAINQTRLLVILENQAHDQNWPWRRRDLHECSNAPVLYKNLDEFRACAYSHLKTVYYCVNFTREAFVGVCTAGLEDLGLSTYSLVYAYVYGTISPASLTDNYQLVNDTVPGVPCNTRGRVRAARYSARHNGFDISHSIWEDTNGSRVEELELGRPNGTLCHNGVGPQDTDDALFLRRCNITNSLNSTVARCDVTAVNNELLEVMFNDTVTAYADEHNTAFNMDRGPATDLFTAWAALVTAAVSVITATVPCTNLELEYLARYVYPQKHEKLKWLKFTVLAIVNVGFGMILYAPIFAMILNESNRSKPYYTWSLFTNDVIVNTYGTQMRSVFIIEGQSLYASQIQWIFVVVCGISFPLIVLITVKRCYKVFYRRKLLLRERKSLYGDSTSLSKTEFKEINVRAIEMGLSEYVRLREQFRGNKLVNIPV